MARVDEAIRVRYAPSPTGALHLGGARTALFNYLFARQKDGQFLLRIEDTDRARFQPDSQASIEVGLRWLGMNWDEPPMIQSQRKEVYAEAASVLLELGAAYRCFCTPQRLEQMRAEQRARHEPERYDRRCRSIPRPESDRRAASGERFVVRQAIPIDGTTTFHDLVMGTVTFRNRSEEHTSELQSRSDLVCRLLLEKKKTVRHAPKQLPLGYCTTPCVGRGASC